MPSSVTCGDCSPKGSAKDLSAAPEPPSEREVASRSDDGKSSFHVFHCFQYIPPRFFCQQKQPEKKKKAMENFHRFAGASCLTRTGDTLINSQVL